VKIIKWRKCSEGKYFHSKTLKEEKTNRTKNEKRILRRGDGDRRKGIQESFQREGERIFS